MRTITQVMHTIERRLIGAGAAHQERFYRCQGCARVVTWHQIRAQGGCSCGGSRLAPTALSFCERARVYLRGLRP